MHYFVSNLNHSRILLWHFLQYSRCCNVTDCTFHSTRHCSTPLFFGAIGCAASQAVAAAVVTAAAAALMLIISSCSYFNPLVVV